MSPWLLQTQHRKELSAYLATGWKEDGNLWWGWGGGWVGGWGGGWIGGTQRQTVYNTEVSSISNWRVKTIGGFWTDIFPKIRITRSWSR